MSHPARDHRIGVVLSLVTCAALVSASAAKSSTQSDIRTIVYEQPSCGPFHCPDYTIIVSSDGRGVFVGRSETAVVGTHTFKVNPRQFNVFWSKLAPYRPVGERRLDGPAGCRAIATDQDSLDVRWSERSSRSRLSVYFGCDMEANASMFRNLREAVEALPVQRLLHR